MRPCSQGKKVADGRCGKTIEAKPVFDQTCQIEDVLAAPDETGPKGSREWRRLSSVRIRHLRQPSGPPVALSLSKAACRLPLECRSLRPPRTHYGRSARRCAVASPVLSDVEHCQLDHAAAHPAPRFRERRSRPHWRALQLGLLTPGTRCQTDDRRSSSRRGIRQPSRSRFIQANRAPIFRSRHFLPTKTPRPTGGASSCCIRRQAVPLAAEAVNHRGSA